MKVYMNKVLIIVFLFLLLPTSLLAGHNAHSGDVHINWFGSDTESPPLGWYILNFIIFVGGLVYLLRKPVETFFKDRYDNLKRQMDESIRIRDEALARLKEIEDKLARIDYYVNAIKEEYRDMAKKEKEEIINHAKRTASSLLNSAEQTILFETLELKKEITRQILKSATEKSLSIILSKYSPQRDREIIEEFVESLDRVDRKSFGYLI